jgi:transposase InsO family protein
MEAPSRPNQGWALYSTHEQLATGECLRILTILDEYTREIILTRTATAFKAADVRELLTVAMKERTATPEWLCSDNGSEFVANQSSAFLLEMGIHHARSRPGKPTDKAKIESFHSRFRDEQLDRNLFDSIPHANEELAKYPYVSMKVETVPSQNWSSDALTHVDTVPRSLPSSKCPGANTRFSPHRDCLHCRLRRSALRRAPRQ